MKKKNIKNNNADLQRWDDSIREITGVLSSIAVKLIPDGGVMIDVGANTGVFSEQVLAYRACSAHLFEPVRRYYDYTRRKFTHHPQVRVEPYALGEKKSTADIWIDRANKGWNTMVGARASRRMKKERISVLSFDEYVRRHRIQRIDLIKIDVEGAEYAVLAGMRETLRRLKSKPVILLEIGFGKNAHPAWNKETAMFEWLFRLGYQRFSYDVDRTTDVIFFPKGTFDQVARALPVELLGRAFDGAALSVSQHRRLAQVLVQRAVDEASLHILYAAGSHFLCAGEKKQAQALFEGVCAIGGMADPSLQAAALYKLACVRKDRNERRALLRRCLCLNPAHAAARTLFDTICARGRA